MTCYTGNLGEKKPLIKSGFLIQWMMLFVFALHGLKELIVCFGDTQAVN